MNRKLHLAASLFFGAFALLSLCVFLRTAAYEVGIAAGAAQVGDLIRRLTLSPPAPVAPGIQRLPSAFERSDFWGIAFLLSSALALFWLRRTWRVRARVRRPEPNT